ncbi:MAG: magnesium and cobalt exporter, family [Frankiaceae bacterium]|jgi:CBS domain containing-hemolysin-like protein|nr:magnesium and cobalt exporter, family [Frankiaceae bacterium]
MSIADSLLLIWAALLVLVAGVLAAADTALSRVSRARVEQLVKEERRGAVSMGWVATDPARYLNLLLLLRVAAELTATVLVAFFVVDRLGRGWSGGLVAAGSMVVISFVLIGVAPRTLGRQHSEAVALATAPIATVLARVLGPVPRLLILLGNALTPGRGFRDGPFTTEAELRDMVDLAEESRVIESDERAMIHSVFELGDTLVREVMVPRTDMVWIEQGKTVRQAMSLALRSGFSRIPVVGENEDDVIGVVYLKDLARRVYEGKDADKVEDVMRPGTFVPESKPVDELLRDMQTAQIHIAVVIDEYGGTAGLVTIEDVLEEIVGEITDEYDREAPRIEDLGPGRWRVTARLSLDDLSEVVGEELERDDVETVGGLVGSILGRVPIPGSSVRLDGLVMTVEAAKGRRNKLSTVLVEREAATVDGQAAAE